VLLEQFEELLDLLVLPVIFQVKIQYAGANQQDHGPQHEPFSEPLALLLTCPVGCQIAGHRDARRLYLAGYVLLYAASASAVLSSAGLKYTVFETSTTTS